MLRSVPILCALAAVTLCGQPAPVTQAVSETAPGLLKSGRGPVALEASPAPRNLEAPEIIWFAGNAPGAGPRDAPWLLCNSAICLAGAPELTDETVEWVAIAKVIAEAGDSDQRSSGIFAKDLDSDVNFDRLLDLHSAAHSVTIGMDETWRVLTEPRLVAGGVWFLAHDLALVAAESRIRGAVTLKQSVPLLFVLKKNGPQWTISTVRRLAPGAVIKKASLQSVQ